MYQGLQLVFHQGNKGEKYQYRYVWNSYLAWEKQTNKQKQNKTNKQTTRIHIYRTTINYVLPYQLTLLTFLFKKTHWERRNASIQLESNSKYWLSYFG